MEVPTVEYWQNGAFRLTVAIVVSGLVFGKVHQGEAAVPGIEHDFELGIVRRQNRIGVERAARLAVAIDSDVIVGNQRITVGRGLDIKWAGAGKVKFDRIAV